ncbi:beclin 1 [Kwoniella heveanensis BCC8398]|uniref:Beclin 1 n=1 Tax=Kwoniella heveanensis BCC8398 TaxID=1296120 RepID=A0A1B9GH94_9TREE|nr:beclin 1 [Kwoniella heveanensis BCC8398]
MSRAIASSSKQPGGNAADPSYNCQKCHQPLLLDPSIHDITQSQYSLIASNLPKPAPTSTLPGLSKLASLPPSSHPAAQVWAEANGIAFPASSSSATSMGGGKGVLDSFILLSESALIPPPPDPSADATSSSPSISRNPNPNLIHKSDHIVSQLHAILSSNTPISHPLCKECTDYLSQEYRKKAEELAQERDAYISFKQSIQRNREKQLHSQRPNPSFSKSNSDPRFGLKTTAGESGKEDGSGLEDSEIEGSEEEWNELVKRRQELEREEEQLIAVLEAKEKELDAVREEEERVKEDEAEVDREETDYLLSHSALSIHLSHLNATLSTAQTHLLLSQSLLSHLESTNVYNDAFQIGHVPLDPSSHSGITVGTINGLRLGGRPTVEWEEINAAWGLVALCLDRVADKVGCQFQTYRIVPLGSYSRVEELPPSKNSYELYASSDITPARLLQNRRFNHAMVGVLDCLKQLVDFGKRYGKWTQGNTEIHKDKIGSYSIRLPGISSMPLGLPSMSMMGLGGSSSAANNNNSHHEDGSGSGRDAAHSKGSGSGSGGGADSTAEENWTRACRAVLVVLKSVLIAASEADRGAIVGVGAGVVRGGGGGGTK